MKILSVMLNAGCYSNQYLYRVLGLLGSDIVLLHNYLQKDQSQYDTLIYNTFPNEDYPKFNKELTYRCDEKFHSFKGIKILFDTYDNSSLDGFARFNTSHMPRIKVNPSYELMKKMNIIMPVPFIVYSAYCHPQEERPYKLLCAMRVNGFQVRKDTVQKISRYMPITEKIGITGHARRLCKTLINVVPTVNGIPSRSHADTLAAGALLLAEESIVDTKIFPHIDLKDGEHFVSYNLDNICNKLDWLLSGNGTVHNIRMSGLEAFRIGYNVHESARQLSGWLNDNN